MSGTAGSGAAGSGAAGSGAAAIAPTSFATTSMGGRLAIHLDAAGNRAFEPEAAEAAARAVFARIETWAARLTRHTDTSDLSRLNADPSGVVAVRPTLAAALLAGAEAMRLAPGLVDIALLDARLAAERFGPAPVVTAGASRLAWYVEPGRHRSGTVGRPPGVRFDLGGVGKGWIADRALHLLLRISAGTSKGGSAIVDADGDMAVRTAAGRYWGIEVDDPRTPDGRLATLRLGGRVARTWGVATSGTSIHRWQQADAPAGGDAQVGLASEATPGARTGPARPLRHHLIDPATGLPARTDVVQATVVAGSALHAEAYAKAAVIAGAARGLALLDRSPIRGAVLLLENGDVLAVPRTLELLSEAA